VALELEEAARAVMEPVAMAPGVPEQAEPVAEAPEVEEVARAPVPVEVAGEAAPAARVADPK
jgi:hypothetical protein